jgi:hypothetical protein
MSVELQPTGKKTIPEALREAFLLKDAQKAVESRPAEKVAKIRSLVDAADTRATTAESLSTSDQLPAALVLLREATVLAAHALLEAKGVDREDLSAEAAFSEVQSLVDGGAVGAPPPEWTRARELLTDSRHLAFDELPRSDAFDRRSDVEAVYAWLRDQFEARSLQQIKVSRIVRVGVAIALAAAFLVWVGVWIGGKTFGAKNIAFGAPTQLSSRRAECPPGSGPAGASPQGLVDGAIGGTYDICTTSEVHPWALIDLQKAQPLAKVKVYNRGDCCWGANDLPVSLELSENGTDFSEVEKRTTPYTASDPWVVNVGGRVARFVRLRSDSPVARELVLNEVEVFAAK